MGYIRWKKCNDVELFARKNVIASVCPLWKMFVCPTGALVFRQQLLYPIGYNSVCHINIIPEMV